MSLVRYQPWNTSNQLRRELSHFFNSNFLENHDAASNRQEAKYDWAPSVDIRETEQAFTLHADIPGVEPSDIEVQTEKNILVLKGQRHREKSEDKDGYTHVERTHGQFYRRFNLPESADTENIQAKFNNGVLEVRIAKQQKQVARKIEIEH